MKIAVIHHHIKENAYKQKSIRCRFLFKPSAHIGSPRIPRKCGPHIVVVVFRMALEILSLGELVGILKDADTIAHGEKLWTPIEFTSLALRESNTTDKHWACVQVGAVKINGQLYNINGPDAHISIGTWNKAIEANPDADARWLRQLRRAQNKLGQRSLAFEMALNEEICHSAHYVFNFMVHSTGGDVLTSVEQVLSASLLKSNLWQRRGMSPPGPLFHLSVYDATQLV